MDSHNNNNNNNSNISSSMQTSTGAIDHFFPTSITTSPHFFDPTFLDTSLSFPTSTTTSSWAQPPSEPTNSLNYPPATTTTKLSTAVPGPTGRPSKKRSRASRRAPTTVLTTDTSNFRAMVQEFTGIPAPPFTSSSTSPLQFPRSLNPPPSFLLKPFPHKFQPPFLPTSSLTSPPPPPLPHNNFQSLLQSQLLNMPLQQQQAMAASSSSSELRLPDVIGSGGDQTRHHHHHPHQQQQDAATSCKMNFPGPMSTEFRAEKGSEGREGLMESWICSSD